MAKDVAAQAQASLSEIRAIGLPNIHTLERFKALTFELIGLIPDLIAEIERLQSERNRQLAEAWQAGYRERGRDA